MIAFETIVDGQTVVATCNNIESVDIVTGIPNTPYWDVPAPADRKYRDSWTLTAGVLTNDSVKLNKAKVIEEALIRINLIFPTIETLDDINFFAEFWKSIALAARNATVDFQSVIDIYTVAKTAIANETIFENVVWP